MEWLSVFGQVEKKYEVIIPGNLTGQLEIEEMEGYNYGGIAMTPYRTGWMTLPLRFHKDRWKVEVIESVHGPGVVKLIEK